MEKYQIIIYIFIGYKEVNNIMLGSSPDLVRGGSPWGAGRNS